MEKYPPFGPFDMFQTKPNSSRLIIPHFYAYFKARNGPAPPPARSWWWSGRLGR